MLGRVWNSLVHPFVDIRTSATLIRQANREECVHLARRRYGRDKRGNELAWEIDGATILLHGERRTYEAGQFEFTDEYRDLNHQKAGEIRVDRAQHKMEVRVVIAGKPWKLNGAFRYDEQTA